MNLDPRIAYKVDRLIWLMQEELKHEISAKLKWDILCTVTDVADYFKKGSDKIREDNYELRWNELSIYVKYHKLEGYAEILSVMDLLNEKQNIRWVRQGKENTPAKVIEQVIDPEPEYAEMSVIH